MWKIPVVFLVLWAKIEAKYLEGVINTNDNWVFLARFCFLSEQGQFEYQIEFDDIQGSPNLLLYYDEEDQWPAVYKTFKTCAAKEMVLRPENNQIVTLSARQPYLKDFSGCNYRSVVPIVTSTTATKAPSTTTTTTIKTTTTTKRQNVTKPPLPYFLIDDVTTTTPPTVTTDFDVTSTISTDDYYNVSDGSTTSDVNNDYETLPTAVSTSNSVKSPIRRRSLTRTTQMTKIRNRIVVCHNARRFRSARERWWFIAVSNCPGNKGIHLNYKILLTNGAPGDYWHEHFSADEFYILPVLMAFSIAYSFMTLGIVICSIELKSRQLLHTTYKIFVLSALLQLFGILMTSIAYLKYALHGFGGQKVKRFGSILMASSETLFLLLLLLLAKGFTITRGRLPLGGSIKLTVFMCLYAVTYVSIFVYEANVFDPGEVLYLYESPAGYGLIILRVLAWCMFVYSTIFTLKHYPEKSNFYYPFNVCGTIWFVAGPTFILSANSYIDKWVRESVVCAVLQFIAFGGHLAFLVLTMPSVANKNFPYHVRTTQIGIMELTGTAGASTIEQFGHHVYEPSAGGATIGDQNVIVPLTRRTEEIFEGMYSHMTQQQPHRFDRNDSVVSAPKLPQQRDISMENVLDWSTAKNATNLDSRTTFDRLRRASLASTSSVKTDDNNGSSVLSRRNSSIIHENGNQPRFQDYVKDVPVELFTISKMIVTNNGRGPSVDK